MITTITSSSRKHGNSEKLVDILLEGVHNKRYFLNDYQITKIKDDRHSNDKSVYMDDYYKIMDDFMASDTIIFATPLYWYSMSTNLKLFIDRWTETLRDKRYPNFRNEIKNKKFIVIIVGGDNPALKSIPLQNQFKLIFEFLDVDHYEFIIGEGNKPGDIEKDEEVIEKVRVFNQTLK